MLWQPAFISIIIFVAVAVFFSLRVQSGTQKVADKTEEELGDHGSDSTDAPASTQAES